MRCLSLVVLVTLLVGLGAGAAGAGRVEYSLESVGRGFAIKTPAEPTTTIVFADAVIGRPVGLAMTITGAALFVSTLSMTAPSGDAGLAGWYLVGKPAGFTFNRPLGRSAPQYEDRGIFAP